MVSPVDGTCGNARGKREKARLARHEESTCSRAFLASLASLANSQTELLQAGGGAVDGYGKRVLVVEHDAEVRTVMCVLLSPVAYNVYEARDGVEASY